MTNRKEDPIDDVFNSELEKFIHRDFTSAKTLDRDKHFLVDWDGFRYSVEIAKLEDDADHLLFLFAVFPTFASAGKKRRDATVWFGIDGRMEYRLQSL